MNDNKVFCELMCRACLGSGRLYNIHEYKLVDSFNQLIGTKVLPCDGLPQHLCVMCSTMVLKHKEFRKQCLKVQLILDDIKKRHNVITSNLISEDSRLFKKYTQTITEITEYPQTDPHIIDTDYLYTYQIDVKHIKNEIEMCVDNGSKKIDGNTTDNFNSQLFIDEVHTNDDINEAHVPEFIEVDNEVSENDKHNTHLKEIDIKSTKKSKIKKDKPNKCKHKNKNDKLNRAVEKEIKRSKNDNSKENDTKKCTFKRAAKINKIKGKYFETQENMDNFESMFDVEIVILTKEQQLNDVLDRKSSPNYVNSPFKCQYCFKGFIDNDNLAKHFKSQHDPTRGEVICEFCQYRYKDNRGLNQHLKSHRLKFVCRQCKYVSRTTYNAKEHYKMHRGLMHECKYCEKSYEKISTYLTHMRIHHPAELAWCDLCGEPFIGEFGLNGHKKRAHRDLKFPSDCACACGALFTNRSALQQHHAHGCGQTPCSLCGMSFTNRMLLKDHLLESHRRVKEYYSCTECTKTFRRESLYSAHYRRMHVDSTQFTNLSQHWVCEVCGKTLPNRCRLVYHQREHTGERPYQCTQCPKSFTMAKLLASHSRVHSNDRPFACKFCPKTFKGPSALRGHEYMHTGGRTKNTKSRNIN